ncbi:hypothetical protein WMY93_003670 [Mugilogobius chulae]|uniref:Voltage-dependent calcium channel gamma-5 subunit n=1 Tax=Mugilogobius chulae TaxID=88201 RepID=A0AAW0Q011_9GOBI
MPPITPAPLFPPRELSSAEAEICPRPAPAERKTCTRSGSKTTRISRTACVSVSMSACSRKALTLLSSVFALSALGLLGVAVSTDYWLYLEEGVIVPLNQTTDIKSSLHSGLWRVCFLVGEETGRCFTIEYIMPMNVQLTSESTVNVLKMIRSATPFPLVSLFFMFIGFVLNNIGHVRPHRTILAFVSGIFFILSGLALVVGLVLYISSINDEVLNRTKNSERTSPTSMAGLLLLPPSLSFSQRALV